jgi:F-type H+-transporting ATPase subunit delta
MKISKEAKKGAKTLHQCCVGPNGVDAAKVGAVLKQVAERKPAASAQILHEFFRLIRLELDKHTAHVETAREADPTTRAGLESSLRAKYGAHVEVQFSVNPELISGVRIRLGSNVWDANVRERLHTLEFALAH